MTCASGRDALSARKRGEPVEARHHDVEQDDVGCFGLFHRGEQLVAPCVAPRFIAAQRKERPQIGRKRRVVVDDGDVGVLHLSPCKAIMASW